MSVYTPVVTPVVSSVGVDNPRYESNFNGVDQYGTIPAWSPAGALWSIPFKFTPDFNAAGVGQITLLGDSSDTTNIGFWLYITVSNRKITLRTSDNTYQSTDNLVNDLEENTLVVAPSGFTLNGVFTPRVITIESFDTAGVRYDSYAFMAGTISNLRLTDYDDPSNSRFYPMDEGSGAVCRDVLSGYPELVTNGDFSDGLNGWKQTKAGAWTVSDNGARPPADADGWLFQNGVADIGTIVSVEVVISNYVSGDLRVSLSNGGLTFSTNGNGSHAFVGELTENTTVYLYSSGAVDFEVVSVSIKQSNAINLINSDSNTWSEA